MRLCAPPRTGPGRLRPDRGGSVARKRNRTRGGAAGLCPRHLEPRITSCFGVTRRRTILLMVSFGGGGGGGAALASPGGILVLLVLIVVVGAVFWLFNR